MKIAFAVAGSLALALVSGSRPVAGGNSDGAAINLAGTWKLNKELSDNPGAKVMEAMRNAGGSGGRGMGGGRGGGGGMGGGGGRGGGMGGGRGGGMGGGRGGGGMGGERGGPGSGGGMLGGEPPLDGSIDSERPPRSGDSEPTGQAGGTESENAGRRRQGPPPEGSSAVDDGSRRLRGGMRGGPIPSPEFTVEQEGESVAFRTPNNLRLLHSDGEKRKKEGDFGNQDVVARFVKGTMVVETKGERGGKKKETYTLRDDKKLQIEFEIEGSGRMPGMKFKLVYDAAAPPAI